MTKRTLQVLITLSLVSASSFAAQERVIRFQNQVRVGYDSNIYQTPDGDGSGYIAEIINLSAKLNFSTRTDMLLYWQPEFQYRFDADPEFLTYQDLYARLNHAISQRLFLTLSDTFRYQQKEGQTGPSLSEYDATYFQNNLMGALDYMLDEVSNIKVGAGYDFRIWDDTNYGEVEGNNFDQIVGNAGYYRQLKPNKTTVMAAVNYSVLDYDGNRGGYDATSLFVGADQNFNPSLSGFGRIGVSMMNVDGENTSSDSTTPYLQGGLEYTTSGRTLLTGTVGYQPYRSENSAYNAQDRFNVGVGARHDLTAKISLTAQLNYILSLYEGSYEANSGFNAPDVKDNYLTAGVRCAYQVNRNNFIEAGYLFRTRSADTTADVDWDSNRVDLGWRLRL
ncbi:outer membrane beta-barrel protein [Pontiellaceae bacterium B1224]|nr:outer membrane beta-barrel protein [Pontiellaceae bacterium B1224]